MSAQQSVLGNLRSALGNLHAAVTKAVQDMSDDEIEKLARGELHLSISFKERGSGVKSRKSSPAISEEELRHIQTRLDAAQTREEGHRIVQDAFRLKEQLLTFAKFLDLPVQKKDRVDRIREKIVTSTVGRRLSSKAIRGGYSAT